MAEKLNNAEELFARFAVPTYKNIKEIENKYPVKVNEYFLSLVDTANLAKDPLWRQIAPDPRELADSQIPIDGLGEKADSPLPRLVHRYPDRVVLLSTKRCAVHCRFCFRKRLWKDSDFDEDISDEELDEVIRYLSSHSEVKEVLISGGDPLMLSDERLLEILKRINYITSIDTIRLGTRIPGTFPSRITNYLANALASITGLWVATHFNHPNELTEDAKEACSKLVKAGIPVVSQTVLLAGVNDNADTLAKLFQSLVKIRIKPLYLYHVDPVRGVEHFSTGIEKGLEILSEWRGKLSSLATPTFAIDMPNGSGKVPIQLNHKDYLEENLRT